ncbi:MAG: nucleotidyl transferase AbiEii/AbiGii toxin family protein [bacterium]
MKLSTIALGKNQQRVLKKLGPLMTEQKFYLAGGTAIAIHLAHRYSVDLDWFTNEHITDPLRFAQNIKDDGTPLVVDQTARGTLHGSIHGVRVSFLEYRYPLLDSLLTWEGNNCFLASLDDLACMKLSAVAQRGSKKDFIDIYALGLKHKPLEEMLNLYQRKFNIKDIAHVLYSLTYFEDAEKERTPKMLWEVNWEKVKHTIQGWMKELAG